jgi:hypothetical protein
MSDNRQITNETVLFAQAMQIAIELSKRVPQILDGNAQSIESALDGYKPLATVIYRYLLNQ